MGVEAGSAVDPEVLTPTPLPRERGFE